MNSIGNFKSSLVTLGWTWNSSKSWAYLPLGCGITFDQKSIYRFNFSEHDQPGSNLWAAFLSVAGGRQKWNLWGEEEQTTPNKEWASRSWSHQMGTVSFPSAQMHHPSFSESSGDAEVCTDRRSEFIDFVETRQDDLLLERKAYSDFWCLSSRRKPSM